jgi:XRE family transcriptional regulator, regulator of sulfur utilization
VDIAGQLASNLRRRREGAGLSQDELAAAAGVHRSEVSRLERAQGDPRLSTIVRIAAALEIGPDTLLAPSAERPLR